MVSISLKRRTDLESMLVSDECALVGLCIIEV